jgi:ectoine hydroxylase-related dioxygenase (phytanoyl-CoA dioxygenase family)
MIFRSALKKVDQRLNYPLSTLMQRYRAVDSAFREQVQTQVRLSRLWLAELRRRQTYRGAQFDIRPHRTVVERINSDGFVIIKDAVDKSILLDIKRELEEHVRFGTCLGRISKDSLRSHTDLGGPTVFLDAEEVLKGQDYYKHHTNNVQVNEPLLNCPSVVKIVFNDLLIDIAAGYLRCFPAVGTLNLRRSFANNLPELDTNLFHSDQNSPKFLKFFFYLNDVDENGGPFCYVRGSHKNKFKGWTSKYRWTLDEIVAIYGEDKIVKLTANLGDMIVADTTGFHRGAKARSADRSMLTVDYVIHPEYWTKLPHAKIGSLHYRQLTDKQKAAADFLEVVDSNIHMISLMEQNVLSKKADGRE